jgi:hypothetical protein
MARQSHTPLTALGTKTDAYSAGEADLTMTAADAANYEEVSFTGNEIIIAHNTGASERNVTISSVADSQGRDGDISSYALAAGDYAVFGPFELEGWRQSGGKLYFQADNAEVKFGVVKLPG